MLSSLGRGQNDPLGIGKPLRNMSDPGYRTAYVDLAPREFQVQGNPFENEARQPGKILFQSEVQTFLFRFNALRDRVELKDGSGRLFHLYINPRFQPYFGGKYYNNLHYFSVAFFLPCTMKSLR